MNKYKLAVQNRKHVYTLYIFVIYTLYISFKMKKYIHIIENNKLKNQV